MQLPAEAHEVELLEPAPQCFDARVPIPGASYESAQGGNRSHHLTDGRLRADGFPQGRRRGLEHLPFRRRQLGEPSSIRVSRGQVGEPQQPAGHDAVGGQRSFQADLPIQLQLELPRFR